MNKNILIGMSALALTISACAKRTPPPEQVPQGPVTPAVDPNSTDPNSLEDFPSFCHAAGHELLEATQVEDAFRFVIKKGQD